MKTSFIIIFSILVYAANIQAQSTNQNYVLTRTYTTADGNAFLDQIQYFDGLGRPIQTVQRAIGAGTDRKDLITYTEYDGAGRESIQWLPVPKAGNNGAYMDLADIKTEAANQYGSTEKPYSTIVYEPSPLNRITGQYGAGKEWYNNTKRNTIAYEANTVTDNVAYFYADAANNLVRGSNYGANTLFKTVTKDEDNKSVTEFRDKLGQVVMKRSDADVDTYFVYNDLGQLCYVIPPLAADALKTFTLNTPITDSNASALKQYCYWYKYDERGNCTEKRLPGCDWIYMVYDKANRLVLSQDGNQRNFTPDKWTATFYDSYGRVVVTQEISADISVFDRSEISNNQLWVYDYSNASNLENGYCGYFTGSAETTKFLIVNYYDNYNFLNKIPEPTKTQLNYTTKTGYDAQYIPASGGSGAKGLLTGTRTYYLDGSGNYSVSAVYYDYRGRVVQTRSTNHLGGFDITYNQYNFSGQVTKSLKEHNIAGQVTIRELYSNDYDHAGRLKFTKYKLNENAEITLNDMTDTGAYDDLGRLKKKRRHSVNNGAFQDTEEFDYNIRNWPERIKSGGFEEKLFYNTGLPSGVAACYNGNIAYQTWKNGSPIVYAYKYTYDNLNRLKYATAFNGYNTPTSSIGYSEDFGYDKQGNINYFQRKSGNTLVDYFAYQYTGNQITGIFDYTVTQNSYNIKEYQDKNHVYGATTEMSYDPNGNLTKDLDRDIVTIRYNLLNLPEIVQFKNGNQIRNLYDAGGQKLKTTFSTLGTPIVVPVNSIGNIGNPDNCSDFINGTDYIANFEYSFSNDCGDYQHDLNRIYNIEGYVTGLYVSTGSSYFYFRKDHLGNNREVWNATNNTTVQRTQYYPSGVPWVSNTGDNPWLQNKKYNGKEFVEMHGLDEYDSEARWFYPAIMRTTTLDPLAEKYYSISPYAWCGNNPVGMVDPDGMEWFWYSVDGKADPTWNWRDEKEYHTGVNDENGKEVVLQGKEAVVVAEGSLDEKLGEGNNLFGKGAKLATFTVYGPSGKDDIKTYRGFTMTSNFKKYGAIANGEYEVNFRNPGKSGRIKSNWAVNNTRAVNCLFGCNPNPIDPYSSTQKDGIYFHSTLGNEGKVGSRTSTGCILIVPSGNGENGWNEFNVQLSKVSSFHFVLNRTVTVPFSTFQRYPTNSENKLQYNSQWLWKNFITDY